MTDHTRTDSPAADRFAEWDAAYVLGALSPADRHAYEEHLVTCDACSIAVRDLAGMPGLLGALPHEEALALLDDVQQDAPDLVPALLHRVRRTRRIRRWSLAGVVVAAAAVATTLALVIPAVVTAPPSPAVAASLQQVGATAEAPKGALSADVTLTAKDWGTSIGMVCRWSYETTGSNAGNEPTRWGYGLWVIARDGTTDRVATWSAGAGDVVRTNAATSIPVKDITRIELRLLDTGKVLLAKNVAPAVG